jgi:hypothetical protein
MGYQPAHPDALTDLERSVVDAVSTDEPWALLEEFSELERVSGTEDEKRAAEYLTDRLAEFGVDHERHDPELYVSQPHDASVTVHGHGVEPGPVKTVAFSASTTVSGPVEYVGSPGESTLGTVEDRDVGHRPYEDVGDLSGTVALTAAGSLSIRATRILEEKGADAVIAIHQHEDEPHDGIATPVWGGAPRYDERDRIPEVPVVNVTRPDGERLRELAGTDDGVEVTVETDLTTGWFECPLVEARVEGGDDDDFVLLHAHYDSWAVGITDNATGDAALLELARVFDDHADDLRRDLRICWWPAHSTGRYAGSTWYADEFAHDLAERCVAHVNCDSPGARDATEYTDMSCWTPEAHPLVADTIEDVADAPYEEHHPHRAGDYSFDNLGVSGFFMLSSNIPREERERRGYHQVGGCGGNSDAWHLSTDTLDKAGEEEFHRDAQVYAVSVLRTLNAEVLPLDHVRNVDRIAERVREYDDAAGDAFDFSPTLEELDRLRGELAALYDAAEDGRIDPDAANESIKRCSRTLTRLNLVRRGQFEQDPAVSREPVPRYAPAETFARLDAREDGDERRFLALQLKREQNDVTHELRRLRASIPAV